MQEQVGWRALLKQVRLESASWASTLPQLPRLLHTALARPATADSGSTALTSTLLRLQAGQRFQNRLLTWIAVALSGLLIVLGFALFSRL